MGVVDDKRRWFQQALALRQAERAAPGVREIPAVRAQIEQQIGSALSMSAAAKILDVSETTIRRWVKQGDLPLVVTETGRRGVPVRALEDLYEQVSEQRAQGRTHVLEPGMVAARQAAERMSVDAPDRGADLHDRSSARALAYHRAIANKLTRAMADQALHRVWEWQSQDRIAPEYARGWEDLLRSPVKEIRRRISSDDQQAADLRQNSPFAGMLSEPERRRILAEIQ